MEGKVSCQIQDGDSSSKPQQKNQWHHFRFTFLRSGFRNVLVFPSAT
jgi:hypothetical protein